MAFTAPRGALIVRPAEPADAPALKALARAYPFKGAQRRVQRLEAGRLADWHARNLAHAASRQPLWVAEAAGEILAVGGAQPDAWHSDVYQMKMARLVPWLHFRAAEAGPPLLERLLEAASADGVRHLAARLDGDDGLGCRLFEDHGFHVIDLWLKFTRPLPPEGPPPAGPDASWRVEPFRPEDAAWALDLGGRHHDHAHFLHDAALPAERTRALFAEWVRRCVGGLAYRIYALRDPAGRGRGFVIYLEQRGFAEAIGRRPLILDYVILEPEARGGGLGAWLIDQTLRAERGFDYCELRTSHRNLAAVACYEKLGFRLCATDLMLSRLI